MDHHSAFSSARLSISPFPPLSPFTSPLPGLHKLSLFSPSTSPRFPLPPPAALSPPLGPTNTYLSSSWFAATPLDVRVSSTPMFPPGVERESRSRVYVNEMGEDGMTTSGVSCNYA